MLMRIANIVAVILLAMATALLGLFYIGSEEQHAELLEQYFWGTLVLRFVFVSAVGLVGAALWWGVNWVLLKSGLVQRINLRKTALLLIAGAIGGALAGALFFCLS